MKLKIMEYLIQTGIGLGILSACLFTVGLTLDHQGKALQDKKGGYGV